jgi:hypothetical protein
MKNVPLRLFKMKVTPIISSYAGNEKPGNKG